MSNEPRFTLRQEALLVSLSDNIPQTLEDIASQVLPGTSAIWRMRNIYDTFIDAYNTEKKVQERENVFIYDKRVQEGIYSALEWITEQRVLRDYECWLRNKGKWKDNKNDYDES